MPSCPTCGGETEAPFLNVAGIKSRTAWTSIRLTDEQISQLARGTHTLTTRALPSWEDRGTRGGVHEWRLRLSTIGRRKFVRIYQLSDGTVQAETASGYIRRCASIEEAKAHLEQADAAAATDPNREARRILNDLLDWYEQMGGFDAPCWARARTYRDSLFPPDEALSLKKGDTTNGRDE